MPVKSKVEISQNFVAFSEYMNFKEIIISPFAWEIKLFLKQKYDKYLHKYLNIFEIF